MRPEGVQIADEAESWEAAVKLVDHRGEVAVDLDPMTLNCVLTLRNITHGVDQAGQLVGVDDEVWVTSHALADALTEGALVTENVANGWEVLCQQLRVSDQIALNRLAGLTKDCATTEDWEVSHLIQGALTHALHPPGIVVLIAVPVEGTFLKDVDIVTTTCQGLEGVTHEDQVTGITDEKLALKILLADQVQPVKVALDVWPVPWLVDHIPDMAGLEVIRDPCVGGEKDQLSIHKTGGVDECLETWGVQVACVM